MQHVSVFQDSVVIIPTSSACFNPYKGDWYHIRLQKLIKFEKQKKSKGKKNETKLYANIVWVHTLCIIYHVTQQCSSINKDKP